MKLNLSAPKLEPPFEMTSPHPLMSQGRTPRLRMTGFFEKSEIQDIKKKLEAKGYTYVDYLSLKREQRCGGVEPKESRKSVLERTASEGDSPVFEDSMACSKRVGLPG